MHRRTCITTLAVRLLAMFLLGGTAGIAHAQGQTPGQQPMMGSGMMGQGMCAMGSGSGGMMGQGMCPMCSGMMGMMGMMDMMGGGQMDAKTRGQMLQMRGEMLKAMGDIMLKQAQVLGQKTQ
jgi:hypothetical protein